MKGYAMLKIGESGWIEKERPKCGPMDAICRPLAVAICTSDVHTLWEGAIGDRHNMILGHECCAEVVEVGELEKISNRETGFLCRPSLRTGILWKHRLVIQCTPAECWQAGNSPTSKMVSFLNSFM